MAEPGTIDVAASARRHAGRVEVTLRLDIPHGTHIEPHEPADPLFIPTVVDFGDLEVSSVAWPEAMEKDLGLPGPPLLVYQGRVSVTAVGRVDETLSALRGTIRYQPCVGGACLPPREQTWEAPIAHDPTTEEGERS